MPIAQQVVDDVMHATVEGELTIFTVEELKDTLFGLLNYPQVALDLAQISELDGCAAQMLVILLKEAAQSGRRMHIVKSNALVDEALQWLGIVTVSEEGAEVAHGSEQG